MESDKRVIGTIGVDADGAPLVKEPIFISLGEYNTSKYVDIRKYYSAGGEWRPTKKGITLHKGQDKELIKILEENSDIIKDWIGE